MLRGSRQNQLREEVSAMRSKILIASGLALAFLVGAMANGIYTTTSRAFNPTDENAISTAPFSQSAPVVNRTHLVQPRTVYVSNPAPVSKPVSQTQNKRSLQKSA